MTFTFTIPLIPLSLILGHDSAYSYSYSYSYSHSCSHSHLYPHTRTRHGVTGTLELHHLSTLHNQLTFLLFFLCSSGRQLTDGSPPYLPFQSFSFLKQTHTKKQQHYFLPSHRKQIGKKNCIKRAGAKLARRDSHLFIAHFLPFPSCQSVSPHLTPSLPPNHPFLPVPTPGSMYPHGDALYYAMPCGACHSQLRQARSPLRP